MAISGSRFELAFYGYPWWPYFIFFSMFKTLLNYHILKYGVPIIRSCRTHVFIGCGNILSLYVKYGTVSLGLRFTVIFFWNCITQKQSHIETPYRQWRHSVVMTVTSAGDSPKCAAEQPMAGGYHLVRGKWLADAYCSQLHTAWGRQLSLYLWLTNSHTERTIPLWLNIGF